MSALYQLNTIFQEVFDDPTLQIVPQTSTKDIANWDSVAQVKLVLSIEEAFHMRLDSDEVANIHSVSEFLAAIESGKGAGK